MAVQWFVKMGGRHVGPFTAQELKQMAVAGELTRNSVICRRTNDTPDSKWVPAYKVKGLFTDAPLSNEQALPQAELPPIDTRDLSEDPPPVTPFIFQEKNRGDAARPSSDSAQSTRIVIDSQDIKNDPMPSARITFQERNRDGAARSSSGSSQSARIVNELGLPQYMGLAGIIGFYAAHHFALWGGLALIGFPYSPARYSLVPGHVAVFSLVFTVFGMLPGVLISKLLYTCPQCHATVAPKVSRCPNCNRSRQQVTALYTIVRISIVLIAVVYLILITKWSIS
jgi:hypothetical protein